MTSEIDTDATAFFHKIMPFTRTLGIRVLVNTPEQVRARLDWSAELCTTGGVLHGGALMSLADSTGAACAFLNLPEGAKATTTVESKTNFLRAAGQGHVDAVSTPLHVGRTLIVVETSVLDAREKLVVKVTQSQLVLRPS
ncbi:PaaI family thioesterase [Pseudonocardia spinosispora]|uniref:PaaI family thioesterase n=1 Tax=Pseudonocardia spinosispora TaxID=103441 RepID=UPI000490BBD7|nr:PaaI family thioesterase [Pseudonocardia spinosispora]